MALPPPRQLHEPVVGLVIGLVTDNKDPEGIYRVQVKYPVPSGDILSAWARVKTLMAGPDRGWACLPEKDDEVLLRFVNGHPDFPIVVGSVHNGKDKPPFDNADGKNDLRVFYSRNDHHLIFDDTSGSENILIETAEGVNKLEMKTADKKIAFTTEGDFIIKCASGKLQVDAGTDVKMKAQSGWTGQTSQTFEMKSGAGFDLKGSAGVKIVGPKVSISA